MNLPLRIAFRYLFAKKSHNVINIISAISACGMAIGTAALVIILSVYNGFDSLVRESLSDVEPDLLVCRADARTFVPDGEAFDWAYDCPQVRTMCSILEERVYLSYGERSAMALARGVDSVYEEESPLAGHLEEGRFSLHKGSVPLVAVGSALAYSLDLSPRFLTPVDLYFPDRDKNFSAMNPASSLRRTRVFPSCLFSVNSEIDDQLIILPIASMRELLGCGEEVSGIEIRMDCTQAEQKQFAREMQRRLGPEYAVKDRFMQNPSLYKMMRYEKTAIWMILIFVVIVIAFNIFGSLSMLLIEKKGDIRTLISLGAERGLIRRIFVYEGWMISLLGLAAGLAFGCLLTMLQQRFGFVKMPGSFMVAAYPAILRASDLVLTSAAIAAIGYVIAQLPLLANPIIDGKE